MAMKNFYKNSYITLCVLMLCCVNSIYAHSVQVGYCVSCTGELTLYVEHWHSNENPNSTTMTIKLNVNGVESTVTGSPLENIQNTPYSGLPGCNDPITIFSSCPNTANTYNDWVVFKFPDLPCGVPVIITINSGNTVFTEDGCNMYPASSPTIFVPCISYPPPVASNDDTLCAGEDVALTLTGYHNSFQWQSAPALSGPWTDLPGDTVTPLQINNITATTAFRAIEYQGCSSNPVLIKVNPSPTSNAGSDLVSCVTTTPGSIGVPSTPGYTYSWSPPTGLSSTTAPKPNVDLSVADTIDYVVTTTAAGCTSTDTVNVLIKPNPVSNAGPDISVCTSPTPDTIGTSATSGYTYSWSPATNLSNTAISNPLVTITNASTTTYTVTTTVNGCTSTDSVTVVINSLPVASFVFNDVCLGTTLNVNGTSVVASGSIADSLYLFGDGSAPTQTPSHLYGAAGTYPITLIVTTDQGCIDTAVNNTVVHPNPTAIFSYDNVCDGFNMPFTEASTIPAPDIIQSWIWAFGDSSTLSAQNVTGGHLYPVNGSYNVKLKVISDFGCVDSVTHTVVVNPNPVVNFVADDTAGCDPLCVTFQNLSQIATGTNVLWQLDFGDGSPITSQTLEHCYIDNYPFVPQLYSPTLTVTSDSGCVSTLTKNNYITVYPNPIAAFTIDPPSTTIINPVIGFYNNSAGADTYSWDFGDFESSTVQYPSPHTYADTGTYLITLITATQYQCYDTAYQTITIGPDFVFYVPNAFSPNGDGKNDTFTGKGVLVQEFEMRILDRWGNQLFFTNNFDIPWNGTANGGATAAQIDTYVYQIIVKDIHNKSHTFSGIVSLVR